MPQPRRIILVTYEGAELLDMAGPASVFSNANTLTRAPAPYQVVAASAQGGLVHHGCGTAVETVPAASLAFGPRDSVLCLGASAPALQAAAEDGALIDTLRRAAKIAERYGSVCTGALLLAAAGLTRGRRVTTHWNALAALAAACPTARIDGEALYVRDDRLWTSAGVASGIDMALEMVAQDHGPALKAQVARRLVVYAHRPGHQTQFSELLAAQTQSAAPFTALLAWLEDNLTKPIRVEEMAAQAGMSARSFQRHFTKAFRQPPARFLENLRLERARALVEAGTPVKSVAARVGYRSEAAFRTAFKARYGVPPGRIARLSEPPAQAE